MADYKNMRWASSPWTSPPGIWHTVDQIVMDVTADENRKHVHFSFGGEWASRRMPAIRGALARAKKKYPPEIFFPMKREVVWKLANEIAIQLRIYNQDLSVQFRITYYGENGQPEHIDAGNAGYGFTAPRSPWSP